MIISEPKHNGSIFYLVIFLFFNHNLFLFNHSMSVFFSRSSMLMADIFFSIYKIVCFLCLFSQNFHPIASGYGGYTRKSSYTPEPPSPQPPQPSQSAHLNNGHAQTNNGHSYGYGNGTGHAQYNNPAGLYAHNGGHGDRSLPNKMGGLSISATHR